MVVVAGMARSGLAAARLLREQGVDVLASDRSPAPALAGEFARLGIPFESGGHSIGRFLQAEEIVVSPGVPLEIEALAAARRRGVPIVGELELAFRHLRGAVVAITGSNGKTTTTALVGHILARSGRAVQVGGNIGTAASDLVAASTDETINVLEVSSFQLDALRTFRPRVGVLLNITPDHLDRYAGFEAYRAAKFELFRRQTETDVAILNRDDPEQAAPPFPLRARVRTFGLGGLPADGAGSDSETLYLDGQPVMAVAEAPLRGRHNAANILAALLAGDALGLGGEEMAAAVRTFSGVEHRLETVAVIDGVEFINDSKATNVDSAVKALEAVAGAIILIAGGKDKGTSFAPLAAALAGRVRQVLTLGEAAAKIEAAIGARTPVRRVGSMREAVAAAAALARPGDVVLLAPACASFDQYANYEERGRDFKHWVRSRAGVGT